LWGGQKVVYTSTNVTGTEKREKLGQFLGRREKKERGKGKPIVYTHRRSCGPTPVV